MRKTSHYDPQSTGFSVVQTLDGSSLLVWGLRVFCLSSSGWMSWFGNSIVLFVLYRQRASLQPTDYLTFNLAVSDASISVFGYSRGIIEIFNIFQDSSYIISSIWTCQVPRPCDSQSHRQSQIHNTNVAINSRSKVPTWGKKSVKG